MRGSRIEQSAGELYTSHSGSGLVGLAVNHYTLLKKTFRGLVKRHGISNIEHIRAYLGKLCLSKSDFDALENLCGDRCSKQAPGIKQVPSTPRLRRRFDEDARALIDWVDAETVDDLTRAQLDPNRSTPGGRPSATPVAGPTERTTRYQVFRLGCSSTNCVATWRVDLMHSAVGAP